MMRKKYMAAASAAAASVLVLAACGDDNGGNGEPPAGDGYSVVNVINGTLGDQGFFDDSKTGLDLMEARGISTRYVEAAVDNPNQWRSNLESVSGGDYDIVITGTSQMEDILAETAPQYPNQSYIIYDTIVDAPNVASITYKQNEGSFLAGVLAGLVTTNSDDFEHAQGTKVVGAVGGMDIPVINDFMVGFTAGVHAVDPSIEVLVSYVGDFADSNRGHDLATAMYNQNADVVFQVAGGAGLGVLKAAEDSGRYAIGVDSNQNPLHRGHILASMLKNIGVSLDTAVASAQEGTLEFGTVTEYGIANNGVSLTFEDNGDIVPQQYQDEVNEYAQQVIDGELEVDSAF